MRTGGAFEERGGARASEGAREWGKKGGRERSERADKERSRHAKHSETQRHQLGHRDSESAGEKERYRE